MTIGYILKKVPSLVNLPKHLLPFLVLSIISGLVQKHVARNVHFLSMKFNFVHFSLGHPWWCCMSQVKNEDTGKEQSIEDLPRLCDQTMKEEQRDQRQ